jgi:curved DNA-binding protein CbpA
MTSIHDHLSVLGLTESSPKAALKAAYRREMMMWHPDRFHSDISLHAAATERAVRINLAYEFLSSLHEKGLLPSTTPRTPGTQNAGKKTDATYGGPAEATKQPTTPGFPDASVSEVFVKSSHITSIGYSHTARILYIKFKKCAIYSYSNVPETVYTAFLSAESHGRFANRHIYTQYQFVRH